MRCLPPPEARRVFVGGIEGIQRLLARHRFLRFLVVGGLNTIVGYSLFLVSLALMPTTFIALCVSTLLAVAFNFMTTGSYVFGSRDPGLLLRFYGVYAVVFVYNAVGLAALERLGVGPRVGGLLLLPGAVVTSYSLNRRYVFAQRA